MGEIKIEWPSLSEREREREREKNRKTDVARMTDGRQRDVHQWRGGEWMIKWMTERQRGRSERNEVVSTQQSTVRGGFCCVKCFWGLGIVESRLDFIHSSPKSSSLKAVSNVAREWLISLLVMVWWTTKLRQDGEDEWFIWGFESTFMIKSLKT